MRFIKFNNGDKMPILGLGTWKSGPGEVYQAVLWALEAGYRHIDCAAVYQNEKEVGKALSEAFEKGWVKREDVFVTSKLWNNFHEESQVEKGLLQSMQDLQLDYLDLYLIHWPVAVKSQVLFPKRESDFLSYREAPLSGTWKGMETAKEKGLARHIGVSNFNISKLKEVLENANVKPELNQIESHPFLPQENLVRFCKDNGIALTAYSPLGSTDRPKGRKKEDEPSLMGNDIIKEIARKHEV
ncbi:MAG: aldo/keto reductase, partial [Cyclobacteriaceae bacterium]